ncbi:MAG: hypothetical protein JXJ22_08760 [Bacteroidales bacterium]|nr:hypothetical protein [Bacteroidales bacterium]
MENLQSRENNTDKTNIELSGKTVLILKEIRKWANFLAIIGFIGVGILAIVGLVFGFFLKDIGIKELPYPSFVIGMVYLVIALLYYFPVLYLYRFAKFLKVALENNNEHDMVSAFTNLKSHYRFIGILAIILLSFYALIIVFTALGAIVGALAV